MEDLFSFRDWLDNIGKLPDHQRKEILNKLLDMEDEEDRKLKEQGFTTDDKSTVISCPHCGSVSVKKNGTKDKKQRYLCKDCRKTFMETTNTFFSYSHIEEWQWKEIIRGIVEGLSIRKIASNADLGVTGTWYCKNKILEVINDKFINQDTFTDIAECDETFLHLSYKGKRNPRFFIYFLKRMPRHHRSREEKIEYLKKYGLWEELQQSPEFLEYLLSATKRSETSLQGTNEDSVCILTGIDRDHSIYIKPTCLGSMESNHVTESFENRFAPDAIIVTDGNTTYNWFAEESNIHHEVIPADKHAVGPYSLSRVNSLHSSVKAHYPKHKGNLPATKYLDIGLGFFWWLEKNKDKSTKEKIDLIYQILQEADSSISFDKLKHRKLTLDTKGLIPTEV